MAEVIAKGFGIWLSMVIAAILNGLTRDKLLTPLIGGGISLPISGITLSGLVFVITYLIIPFFGAVGAAVYLSAISPWVAAKLRGLV